LAVGELLPLIHHQPECLNLPLVQTQGAQIGDTLFEDQVQDAVMWSCCQTTAKELLNKSSINGPTIAQK
jgi:hypothetical protein